MNKFLKILLLSFCVIAIILSLAFIFIEGRLLFCGDWRVYQNPVNGFIRYLFRLLIAIITLLVCLFEMLNINKNKDELDYYITFVQAGLIVFSAFACAVTANYVGIICLVLNVLIFDLKLLLKARLNSAKVAL